jgi:sugar/nucleoside kinase (ribokinase family)
MAKSFDIVGLGLATVDILTVVPQLPQLDSVFAAKEIALQGGGPAATALVAASKLGASTSYLGVLGEGRWGRITRDEFETYGVDSSHALVSAAGDQSLSVILIDEASGRRSIMWRRGGLPDLQPDEVPAELIRTARALHLDGVYAHAARRAAQIAQEAGVLVSFDGGAGELWPDIEAILPLVDVLVVARAFAGLYTGESDPQMAGPALLQKYQPQQVVITDGENGAWYWDGVQELYQPAFRVPVVDTTGAGDTFHGAYLYAHLQDWGPQHCLAFAAATAAMKCRHVGGRAGIPGREEVELFLQNHKENSNATE